MATLQFYTSGGYNPGITVVTIPNTGVLSSADYVREITKTLTRYIPSAIGTNGNVKVSPSGTRAIYYNAQGVAIAQIRLDPIPGTPPPLSTYNIYGSSTRLMIVQPATGTVSVSTDGNTWRTSQPFGNVNLGVPSVSVDGPQILINYGNISMARSADNGQTWTVDALGSQFLAKNIFWDGTQYVINATTSIWTTAGDGSYTQVSTVPSTSFVWRAASGTYYSTRSYLNIYSSSDLVTWTLVQFIAADGQLSSEPAQIGTHIVLPVAGQEGKIIVSHDSGATWTEATLSIYYITPRKVVAFGGKFIVLGQEWSDAAQGMVDVVWSSTDATTWSSSYQVDGLMTNAVAGLASTGAVLFAAFAASPDNLLYTSINGTTWVEGPPMTDPPPITEGTIAGTLFPSGFPQVFVDKDGRLPLANTGVKIYAAGPQNITVDTGIPESTQPPILSEFIAGLMERNGPTTVISSSAKFLDRNGQYFVED